MNAVDASDHVEVNTSEETPSLYTVIIDTNPRAWAAIGDTLSLSKAVSNILVFLNANLAFSNANQVAVIAAHTNRAVWLYPTKPENTPGAGTTSQTADGDVNMTDASNTLDNPNPNNVTSSANKYPQFAQIETAVLESIKKLVQDTSESDLKSPSTTQLSGALTLALSYINKTSQAYTASKGDGTTNGTTSGTGQAGGGGIATGAESSSTPTTGLSSSVLVLSVSDSEPSQYIPTMNAVFAAAHASIPIDVISLSPSAIAAAGPDGTLQNSTSAPAPQNPDPSSNPSTTTNSFLQQASHITNGVYLQPASPHGLLTYLLFAYTYADAGARAALVPPTHHTVDFRAACFCHGRVVDTGFVCSVCLSIFCSVPEGGDGGDADADGANGDGAGGVLCLTCSTRLALGNFGAKPAVVPPARKAKKKKRKLMPNGSVREETGSAAATPVR